MNKNAVCNIMMFERDNKVKINAIGTIYIHPACHFLTVHNKYINKYVYV